MKNILLLLPLIIFTSCGERPSAPPPVTPAQPPTVEHNTSTSNIPHAEPVVAPSAH